MKILKLIFLILIAAHLVMSAKIINKWFTRTVMPTARRTTGNPDKDIFVTLNKTQASFITMVQASVPHDGHFLWRDEIDPMVNYYIYPRRSYASKDYDPAREAEFLRRHGIACIVSDFASGRFIPVDKP